MSAASEMCGSSSGLAVARFAYDCQTCGDPAPARHRAGYGVLVGEREPGLRGAAARLLERRPACPASRPAPPLAPHIPDTTLIQPEPLKVGPQAMAATTLYPRLTQVSYGVTGWGTGELVL